MLKTYGKIIRLKKLLIVSNSICFTFCVPYDSNYHNCLHNHPGLETVFQLVSMPHAWSSSSLFCTLHPIWSDWIWFYHSTDWNLSVTPVINLKYPGSVYQPLHEWAPASFSGSPSSLSHKHLPLWPHQMIWLCSQGFHACYSLYLKPFFFFNLCPFNSHSSRPCSWNGTLLTS